MSWFSWYSEARRSFNSMNLFEKALFLLSSVGFCSLGIWYAFDLRQKKQRQHSMLFVSTGFMLMTFPVIARLIYLHLTHWVQPKVQKYVVRIILMIPVYSFESWLALRFRTSALFIETAREWYEAYAIYNFFYLLISLLGEEMNLIAILKDKPASRGVHPCPLSLCLSPWIMGHDLLFRCKLGVLQYVVLKFLTAISVYVLVSCGVYGEGQWVFHRGYLYICLLSNMSQLWALYCLVLFYVATKEELVTWRPVGKFLCVKMVSE